jgi:hypothetical protein
VGFLPQDDFLLQKVVYGVIFFDFFKNAIFLIDEFIREVVKSFQKMSSLKSIIFA